MSRNPRSLIRPPLGIAAGIAVSLALVVAVEAFSSVVHPLPSDFDGSMQSMCDHVARYPAWVLAVAILMWGASAGAGAAVARGVGGGVAAPVTVAVLVVAALAINLWMLPYPWWFEVGSIVAVSAAMAPSMRSNVH